MTRSIIIVLLLLTLSVVSLAQTTSVTLQVTDVDSQTWNNGSWSVVLTRPPGTSYTGPFTIAATGVVVPNQQQNGSLNASGGASFTLTSNGAIGAVSFWSFQVCAKASFACFVQQVTVNGPTQTVTITPPAIRLSLANPPPLVVAYTDAELVNPATGQQYYNLVSGTQRQWNGTVWTALAGGASFPINPTTGQSISPLNLGQNAATQLWFNIPFTGATVSINNAGGTLLNGHSIHVVYTLVSALGETDQSVDVITSTGAGCGAGTCQAVVTAPFLPAGFTGYTVYSYDSNAGGTQPLKQTVNNACVNITGNCTINAVGVGAVLPTVNTAYVQPPGVQGTSRCSPNTQPFMFLADSTPTYYAYMGLDASNTGSNPPAPYNKLSICRPVWVNDTGLDPPSGRNSLFLIFHQQDGVTVNSANQDRGQFIFTQNPAGDAGSHYGLEGLQVEQDINGTPTITGSPDGEVTAGSFQLGFFATAGIASNAFGSNAIRATFFREPSAAIDSNGMNGVSAAFANSSTVNNAGAQGNAVFANCANSNGGVALGLQCAGFKFQVPSSTANRFGNGTNMFFMPANAAFVPTAPQTSGGDWLLRNDNYNWAFEAGGPILLTQLWPSDAAPVSTTGDITVGGSLTSTQQTIGTVNPPTCSGGASQYTYKFVGVDTNGGQVTGAAMQTTAACTNPLTAPNPATFAANLANNNMVGNFVRVDIYRTAGPMGTGKIGCEGLTGSGCTWTCPHSTLSNNFNCTVIVDNGIVADGTTPPTVNTTGAVGAPLYATTTNCAAVGSAASPSVAACSAAAAGSFSCATNAVNTCTVNTTAVTANSEIFISQREDTTTGTRLGVTCNVTASAIIATENITAVVAGISFSFSLTQPATNPDCFSYFIVN